MPIQSSSVTNGLLLRLIVHTDEALESEVRIMAVLNTINRVFPVLMLRGTSLCLGMQCTLQEILPPLKQVRLMGLAVLLNAVVPLIAWGLTRALPMHPGYVTGIPLVGFASAAPASLKLAEIGWGDLIYAVLLVVLLSILTIAALPIWSALLMPGGVRMNPLEVASTLLLNVPLQLCIGLFIKADYEAQAREWAPPLNRLSTLALLIVIVPQSLYHRERRCPRWAEFQR
jgi:predicted Na+-dependent transporter